MSRLYNVYFCLAQMLPGFNIIAVISRMRRGTLILE